MGESGFRLATVYAVDSSLTCLSCVDEAADRRIPLSEEMTRELAALKVRSRYSADDDPVFAARNGKPLMRRNATGRGFELAAARTGIEGVTFHSMRHCRGDFTQLNGAVQLH